MGGRRTLLKAGAGALLAGASALAWRAWDQGVFSTGEGAAYAAWDHWLDGPAEAPQRLVAAAVLAASPHNTQPWPSASNRGASTCWRTADATSAASTRSCVR
jgi:hypothetical protein